MMVTVNRRTPLALLRDSADNPAIGTAMFGYLLGLVFVLAGLLATELPRRVTRESLAWDLTETAIFGVALRSLRSDTESRSR